MRGRDRCRCRPGCLTWLTVDDDLVLLDNGYALREHVEPAQAYPQEPLFEVEGRWTA